MMTTARSSSTLSISIRIQTHPARSGLAADLLDRIGEGDLAVDPDPTGYPSPWRTYRHALETRAADASHVAVIQDDALVCKNFAASLPLVVAARPDVPVVLFTPCHHHFRRRFCAALERGETFLELPTGHWVPAVAVVWPAALVDPILAFVDDQHWPETFRADDEILGRACTALELRPVATVPCLVEHPDVVPSITGFLRHAGGANLDRVAVCFLDWEDPLKISWT